MAEYESSFPVDDFTLDQIEHALNTCYGEMREDGSHELVGGEFTLTQLLDFLSGYDENRSVHTGYIGATPLYEYPDALYTPDSVIQALIAEVRRLRFRLRCKENHG